MRSFLSFAISRFYSLFLAKLKRIPIYPFAPCTGPQIMVESKLFPQGFAASIIGFCCVSIFGIVKRQRVLFQKIIRTANVHQSGRS